MIIIVCNFFYCFLFVNHCQLLQLVYLDRTNNVSWSILGGNNISPGYYKNPEKTKEDFFEEDGKRWFKTGDIGEIHEDGCLKIIDRKKDLVKLQAGEYVSLGKVESQLKTCPLVENICIYGDPSKDHTVALLVPNPTHLAALAKTLGKPGNLTFEQFCADKDVEQAVISELAAHGKKCKQFGFIIQLYY